MRSFMVVLSLGLLACSEPVNVGVQCVTTETASVECTATQTQGKSEVEACWDFEITCGNGAVVKAPRSCVKVKGGGTEKVTVLADKLTGLDKCDGDAKPVGKLLNTTINGNPTDQ